MIDVPTKRPPHTRRSLTITITLLIAMSVLAVPVVAASPTISASGGTTSPGETITVSVTVEQAQTVEIEKIPSAWTVESKETAGAFFNKGETSVGWVWGSDQSSKTVTVTFNISSDAATGDTILDVIAEDSDGNTQSTTTTVTIESENTRPVADAGEDQSIEEGKTVTLDGSGSTDSDPGDSLTYEWVQTSGPSVSLQDADTATPEFTAPEVDTDTPLTFELTVRDESNTTSTDTIQITVTNKKTQSKFSGTGNGGTGSPGDTIQISYTITNNGPDDAAVLDVGSLPSGWSVSSHGGDADAFKSSTNEFVWFSIAQGSDGSATLTLQVPSDASLGTYPISAVIEDGDGNVDDTVSATVTVKTDQANFQVSDLSAPQTGLTGEAFTVEVTVENTGNAEDTQTVEYQFDGSTEATQDVTLGAGESTTVSFSYTPESAGTFTHGVFTDDDSRTTTIDVDDQPGFISGRVSDQNNEDIPNATISIFDSTGDFVKNTSTNANGEYTVEVPPGSYRAEVVAVEQDFQFVTDQAKDLDVESGQVTTANLAVERLLVPTTISVSPKEDSAIVGEESSFTVTVFDQNGDPLSGVPVVGNLQDDSPVEFVLASTITTNSNGRAIFTVTSDEPISDEGIIFEAQGGSNPIATPTITFEVSAGTIKGEVLNENDEPINNAEVELRLVAFANGTLLENPRTLAIEATGPDNNEFSFVGVEAGRTYRVVATDPTTGNTGFNELSLDTGGTTNADVVVVGGESSSDEADETATVLIDDQSYQESTDSVTVVNATWTGTGDFAVAIHDSSAGSPGPIIGWTSNLTAGIHTDVTANLDQSIAQNVTVTAMLHEHSNTESTIDRGGSPVTDTAEITITPDAAEGPPGPPGSDQLSGSDTEISQDQQTADVSVTYQNTNTESVNGPTIEITDLPSGWSIDSVSTDGGSSTSDGSQILYLSVGAGSSVSPTWTLNVPDDVTIGTYTVTANLNIDGSTTDSTDITISVGQTQSIDDLEDQYATDGDDITGDVAAIQSAITDWATGSLKDVDNDGTNVDEIQTLIQRWAGAA